MALWRVDVTLYTHTAPLERKKILSFFYKYFAPLERGWESQ